MIRKITITNHVGDILELPLSDPYTSGFLIREVQGLGPVKANVNMIESASLDGSIYNSARATSRNIVFSFLFVSYEKTIEQIRMDSYRYFPIKRMIKILVETDTRLAETVGYVESNEPDIFSRDEGCQVSVLCPDSYFHAFGKNQTILTGADPLFEFPFSNESTTKKLINFGEIRQVLENVAIFNSGDEDVGITIKIHARNPVRGLVIWNVTMNESMGIDDQKVEDLTGQKISRGDDITIETSKGRKSVILRRKAKRFNILNALKMPIKWLQLQRGENVFAYTADDGALQIDFVIENEILYEGV